LTALGDEGQGVTAQIAPTVAPAVCREFGVPPGTITTGKLISALNAMGFSMVLDAGNFAEMTIVKEVKELSERIESAKLSSGKPLPLISCCSPGWIRFVEEFYPDLMDHLPVSENPERTFKASVKEHFSHPSFIGKSKVTFVSVMPCIAKKVSTRLAYADNVTDKGIVLSSRELVRMIRMAGLDICALPESGFSSFPGGETVKHPAGKNDAASVETFLWDIYGAYDTERGSVKFL
jgi:NADH-quinone oxidoreductase subunit G/NADP-reducing hydrogenase subunit HndD